MTSPRGRRGPGRLLLPAAALVLLVLVAFGRSLSHPFVNLDDTTYITTNKVVRAGFTAAGVGWAFTSFEGANWHPLTWLSHLLDVQLFGLEPAGHHATSLALHALAAALLFLVLTAMTGSAGRSFLVAALFAVHPLHVESVVWVAERKDVLSGLLFVAALAAWLHYVRRPAPGRSLAVAVTFTLGLMAKPMIVTLPFVLLILDWWPLGRLRRGAPAGRRIVEKLPLFALSAAASVVTYVAQYQGQAVAAMSSLSLPWRLANAAVAYLRYLGKTAWPVRLAVFYPHPGHSLSLWWGAAAAALLLLFTLAALRVARRAPWVAAGWFWFGGMLVPVIGLVQVGNQALADRYSYLPLVGIFIACVWSVGEFARRAAVPPRVIPAAAVGLLALLAARACNQAGYWRDSVTLYTHALQVTGDNWFAESNLANEDLRQKRWQQAADRLRRVLRRRTDFPEISFSLGLALMNLGDLDGAQANYRAALSRRPGYAAAENNLGIVLSRKGRTAEAEAHFLRALDLQPDYAEALVNLGVAREAQGHVAEALEYYRRATVGDPELAGARFSHATVLARLGRVAEAEAEYRAAVRLDPKNAWARNNLGNLLSRQGRTAEAVEQLRAAAQLDPEDADIRRNLAREEGNLRGR